MEITGKIVQILPEETGEGKNGPWKKQNFVLETQDQYPKKVCITVWGDKVNLGNYSENETVTAAINIASREFNGKWYTDVTAWRIMKGGTTSEQPPPDYGNVPQEKDLPPELDSGPMDDLPF